jgi:hypothetical protein
VKKKGISHQDSRGGLELPRRESSGVRVGVSRATDMGPV